MTLDIPLERSRKGKSARLVLASRLRTAIDPDPRLVRLLVNAARARRALFTPGAPRAQGHQVRLARLAYLAPDITTAILEGRQPPSLTSRVLLKLPHLPLDWDEQRRVLGWIELNRSN